MNCDLSNIKFDFRSINIIKFKDCKLIEISFINSSLKDIEINNCNLNY